MHHRVFHKQLPPCFTVPTPLGGEGQLQPGALGGNGGLDLLFQGLVRRISSGGLFSVVGFAGRGHGLHRFACLRDHHQLQGGSQTNGKLPGTIVKDPCAIGCKVQSGHNAISQLLHCNAQFLGGVLQGCGRRCLYLTEFELSGNAVYRHQGCRVGADREGRHSFTGDGAPGVLGPFADGVKEFGRHGRPTKRRGKREHPFGFALGPSLHPHVPHFTGQSLQILRFQVGGDGCGSAAAAHAAQISIGHKEGGNLILRSFGVGRVCAVDFGQRVLQKPLDSALFPTLEHLGG